MTFQVGNKVWLGRKHSEETKRKLSVAKKGRPSKLKGRKLSEEFRKKLSESRKGIVFSESHIANLRKSHLGKMKGSEHPRWLGDKGKSPLVRRVRDCYEYRQWRSDIFTRDDFTCQICLVRGGYLEADHYPKMFSVIWNENEIKTFEQAIACQEFWNINNGRTLCRECHKRQGRPKKNG